MDFDMLKNPELQEKLKTVKTPEEFLLLVKEEGCELSEAELEGIAGGDVVWTCSDNTCSTYVPCPAR